MTAKASSAFKGSKRGKAADVVDEAAAVDPQLAEFLQLMQPRVKAKIWGNDELLPQKAGTTTAAAIPGGQLHNMTQLPGHRQLQVKQGVPIATVTMHVLRGM